MDPSSGIETVGKLRKIGRGLLAACGWVKGLCCAPRDIRELREEVEKLKNQPSEPTGSTPESKIDREGIRYWLKDDEGNRIAGPFCGPCAANGRERSPILDQDRGYFCPNPKCNTFEEKPDADFHRGPPTEPFDPLY